MVFHNYFFFNNVIFLWMLLSATLNFPHFIISSQITWTTNFLSPCFNVGQRSAFCSTRTTRTRTVSLPGQSWPPRCPRWNSSMCEIVSDKKTWANLLTVQVDGTLCVCVRVREIETQLANFLSTQVVFNWGEWERKCRETICET